MNTHSATTHRFPATSLAAPIAAALRRVLAHLRAQRERQVLDAELSMLSERDLADIGLSGPATCGTTFGLPPALYR